MSKYQTRKHTGFATTTNRVIKALSKNLECLGFYLFILHLPDSWIFHKDWMSKECKIGEKKVTRYLKDLQTLGIVRCKQKRDDNGRFGGYLLDIYDDIQEEILNENIEMESYQQISGEEATPGGQNSRAVVTALPLQPAIKKEQQNKNLKEKEKKERHSPRKSFCPGTHDLVITEEATKIADEKGLDLQKTWFAFQAYSKSHGWTRVNWKEAFIKWIIDERTPCNALPAIVAKAGESRCLVPEWAPGHPGYDSVHGIKH